MSSRDFAANFDQFEMCSISPESLGVCQADDCAGRWCVTSWHGELKQIVEVYLSIWWTWWNVSMARLVLTQWLEIFEAFVDQYYATVIKNKIHKSCLSGEWIGGESSGGCRNFLETFIHNPQFSVRVWLWCKSAEQILHAKNAWLFLCAITLFQVTLVDVDEDDDDPLCTLIVSLIQVLKAKSMCMLVVCSVLYSLPYVLFYSLPYVLFCIPFHMFCFVFPSTAQISERPTRAEARRCRNALNRWDVNQELLFPRLFTTLIQGMCILFLTEQSKKYS